MKKLLLMGLISISLMACSDDSTSPASFSGKGADYLPTKSNELQTYQLVGQGAEYDLNNQLQSADNANREEKLFIGQGTTISGSSYCPIYIYDSRTGNMDNNPQVYLGLNGNSVIGKENAFSDKLGIALPETISVGTEWVANPFDPIDKHQKVKCLDHLNSYTNKSGNSFSDVIKLSFDLKDSVYENYPNIFEYSKLRKASAVVYLAKNKGLIEASGNVYESKANKYSGSLYGYKKSGNYTLSRKDK